MEWDKSRDLDPPAPGWTGTGHSVQPVPVSGLPLVPITLLRAALLSCPTPEPLGLGGHSAALYVQRDGMVHSMLTGQVGNGVSAVPIWLPSPPPCPARDRMQSLPCTGARAGFPGTGARPWHYRASLTRFPSHGLMLTDDDPLEDFCTYRGREQPAQTPPSNVFINLIPVQSSLPFSPACMSCSPAQPLPSSAKCWITPTAG